MNRETKQAKWQAIINSQLSSGQTQAQWCAENGVNIHNFRYWKNRLSREIEQTPKSGFGFVSLKPSLKPDETVTVRIGSATIEVNASVNLSLLKAVVKVLMHYA